MKKCLILFFSFSLCILNCAFSQGGVWTWISGDSTLNAPGVYGTQGIPSVNNHPPPRYEFSEWKDQQGNLWVYGGWYPKYGELWKMYCDLWKYNPLLNEWSWVKGDSTADLLPVYGTKGVPNIANHPGGRSACSATWVDSSGDLWLFGGDDRNDLWRYNIGTNEWSWVKGDSVRYAPGVHGVLGVPGVLNTPGGRNETCSAWMDSLNNLWLFGGLGRDDNGSTCYLNDLMKYSISTNEWVWMSGSSIGNAAGNYGVKGIFSPTNVPGGRYTHSKWKDLQGNFWLLGGLTNYDAQRNDVWEYNTSINEWAWISGNNLHNDSGNYSGMCIYDTINIPASRREHRSSVTDFCGNFWMFGGTTLDPELEVCFNDLWVFDPLQSKWNWVSGSNTPNHTGSYGTLGIPSVLNSPPARIGAVAWWGNDNRFYMFSGFRIDSLYYNYCDMWVFTPDTNCVNICNAPMPIASFNIQSEICIGNCIDFTNASMNATSYEWIFPGGMPATSNATNPGNICYSNAGSYDVILIATNASGSDTLTLNNCIVVTSQPTPDFSSSTQNICAGECIDFTNLTSGNILDLTWLFPGGIPDTSYEINPLHICYSENGNYDVTLIVNQTGCLNSITRVEYVYVHQPDQPQIVLHGDTLTSSIANVYQWYDSLGIIVGEILQNLIVTHSGYFHVCVQDIYGCENCSDSFYVHLIGVEELLDNNSLLQVYPNPVKEILAVSFYFSHGGQALNGTAFEISIYNVFGEKISLSVTLSLSTGRQAWTVDCRLLSSGIYILEMTTSEKSLRTKFVKQ